MANLEAVKKSRKTDRAAFTKAYNKLEELLVVEKVDIGELEAELNVFKSKADRLEITHASVLELLPEVEFKAEFDVVEDFRDKAIRIETKARRIINNHQHTVSTILHSESSNSDVINPIENAAVEKRRFKLPKLELRKYDGDVKEWLYFWSQFEKIHVDSSIEDSDKFQYLLQSTVEGSRAREVIESFPPTGNNYLKAIECLKTRFGRHDLQVEVYVRELLKLVLKNANSSFCANNLCALYDNLEQQIRALETLGVTTDKSAALLYPLVESCMPEDFLRAWQRNSNFDHGGDSKKRLDSLLKFLKTEVESEERISLAMTGFGLSEETSYKNVSKLNKGKMCTAASLLSTSNEERLCVFCNGKHDSSNCFKAQGMSYGEKIKILREKGICFKCLRGGHRLSKCRSFVKCILCNKMHYAIMCTESSKNVNKSKYNNSEIKEQKRSVNLASISSAPQVLLQTLKVKIIGKNCSLTVRAMYDTGSQKSYIRKEIISVLGLAPLRRQLMSHALFGGERMNEELHNVYKIELGSLDGNFKCNFDVVDQDIICNDVPSVSNGPWIDELKSINIKIFDIKENLGQIDVLIGADVAGRLFTGKRKVLSNGLVAIESYLGWTVIGKNYLSSEKEETAMMVISMVLRESTISDLFSLDVLGISDPVEIKSKREREYKTKLFFEETIKVNEDGRYEVSLPWKEDHLPLPSNKEIAMKRLETSTRKLHHENLFTAYDDVFKEWEILGIIENDPVESSACHHEHYLPHRPVVKQHGTTKVRPVFDASARQVGSPSLNQCLESGPNLLELIPSLLLRFREHKIGIVADIEKAFLQISVRPDDRNFLKFFWWNDKENVSLKLMRHTRVVFGVKSSPFLLEAVLEHHLKKYLENSSYSKKTVDILLRSFYVDDLVTSLDNESEILPFIEESHHILAEGKFNLREWKYTGDQDSEQSTSVLGLIWNRREDQLKINLNWLETYQIEIVSKRVILSVAHRIFDPVGFLCPVLLMPKLMLRRMWKDKVPWDREVEDNIKLEFLKWFEELDFLKNLAISRCFFRITSGQHSISIHTFCDASQFAYAAVVFIRIEYADVVQVNLLAAKSRVSPIKTTTIPRLELLAATVGARLCRSVLSALHWDNVRQHYWTDSTTVLSWIQREELWSVFVNNRVQEIRKLTDITSWKHIPGAQNPADLPSRGCSAHQLLFSRWWEGPKWLLQTEENWPVIRAVVDEQSVLEEKRKSNPTSMSFSLVCSLNQAENSENSSQKIKENSISRHNSCWYYYYFSSYDQILRMIAWIKRFIFNCKNSTSRITGELSHKEIRQAEIRIVKMIQDEFFIHEDNKKRLCSLATYKDENGILRVKTKLTYRKDSEDFKNPIILPSPHQVVKRLIMTEHKKNSHAGLQMLLNILRDHYWILNARKTVRAVLKNCVICLRHAKRNLTAPSASLPENRIKDVAVFEIIGFDLAGPLYLKGGCKAWICIYTCAVFRAVHFELLSSLTTEAFLLSFRRFISRRGRPSTVYCDNGSNFIGASNYLKSVNWAEIEHFSSVRRIQWFFNPPTASWWGGFWERLVGVMKQILRRVLGNALLTYEEMVTVLCDAESIINSRPLSYVSEKDSELIPLSPNTFLQDFRQIGVPDLDQVDEVVLNKRIKYRQQLMADIRKRFRSEYLGLLIQRNELKKQGREIKLGEVVFIGSDNAKCTDWPLGIVIELLPGKDGVIRLVRLRTSKGEFLRPVQRIFPLEVSSSWFKNCQKEIMYGNANNEFSSEISANSTTPVTLKTKSGRTVKRPIKLDL